MGRCREILRRVHARWGPYVPGLSVTKATQAGTAPKDLLIASGIFEGSHRAVPVATCLRAKVLTLKVRCDIFQPIGKRFQLVSGKRQRRGGGAGHFRPQFVNFVGQQQRREQQHRRDAFKKEADDDEQDVAHANDTRGDGADARRTDQLDAHPRARIDLLQVIDQLCQIFDRVNLQF